MCPAGLRYMERGEGMTSYCMGFCPVTRSRVCSRLLGLASFADKCLKFNMSPFECIGTTKLVDNVRIANVT